VVAEIALLLKDYRVHRVQGDRYGGEFPRELFRDHNVSYDLAPKDRSALYLELLTHVNSQRVELPPDDKLLGELRALERHRGPSGRDRVDHPRGQHDDRANAVAGLVALLAVDEGDGGVTWGRSEGDSLLMRRMLFGRRFGLE